MPLDRVHPLLLLIEVKGTMTAIHAVGATAPIDNEHDREHDAAVMAALRDRLPDLPTDSGPGDALILGPFLRPHLHGLHPYVVEMDLNTAVDVVGVLPDGARVLRWHRRSGSPQVLASYDGCLVVVRSWKRAADVWVSGADKDRVTALAADIKKKVPAPPRDRAVRVTFWHMVKHGWHRSRDIDVPTWAEVAPLYPASVRDAMTRLTSYRPREGVSAGRLLLWHGPPGTGKTTAVRALFDAWREWATAHVVSDPEALLNSGDYMAQVLLDPDDEDDGAPWRLVVVEDAEELLRRDARAHVGSALGRLLNTADGLLGQGSKALILLTTNEPVGEMHPALLRPGRCLARVEFPPLSASEASALLPSDEVTAPVTLAELMERRGALDRLEAVAGEERPGLYL